MENIMEETKTKRRTLGQALGLFWQGLTGMITGVVDGIATILGMRDESRYGRVIRRIVGSCFAVIMSVFAVVVFCQNMGEPLAYPQSRLALRKV